MTNTPTRASVTYRGAGSTAARNNYAAVFPSLPTIADLCDTQRTLGYDPCGYGEPLAVNIRAIPSGYMAQWQSYASCD